MTSLGALAILITRTVLLCGMAASVLVAPRYWVVSFVGWMVADILLQRVQRVALAPRHRHIYFVVSAMCFSTVCSLLIVGLGRRGITWWLLAALTLFCGAMVFSMARSIYGPHTKV
jgi:hypothetical protein